MIKMNPSMSVPTCGLQLPLLFAPIVAAARFAVSMLSTACCQSDLVLPLVVLADLVLENVAVVAATLAAQGVAALRAAKSALLAATAGHTVVVEDGLQAL